MIIRTVPFKSYKIVMYPTTHNMQHCFHSSSQIDFSPAKTSWYGITDIGLADYEFMYS